MLGPLQIKQAVALSNEGLNSTQISKELGITEALVKLALVANNTGSDGDRDITNDELALLRQRAVTIGLHGEDAIAAGMIKFLIERDKPKVVEVKSPLIQINQAITTARKGFEDLAKEYTDV